MAERQEVRPRCDSPRWMAFFPSRVVVCGRFSCSLGACVMANTLMEMHWCLSYGYARVIPGLTAWDGAVFFTFVRVIKMKKRAGMAVACVLSGVMLTACGVVVTITVAAAMVATMAVAPTPAASLFTLPSSWIPSWVASTIGATITPVSPNARVNFLFDDGDTCEFALGNQRLGR